jgi:hypothetical protein
MVLQLQDDHGSREARRLLFEYRSRDERMSLLDLYEKRRDVEPALHVLNTVALMVHEEMIPEAPMMGDWGGVFARCWCETKDLVWLRRRHEARPDLWKPFETFGEVALSVERAKFPDLPTPWWIKEFDRTKDTLHSEVEDAAAELDRRAKMSVVADLQAFYLQCYNTFR